MELGTRRAFVVVVLAGVAGTGILVRLVTAAGYPTLASLCWAVGYGGMVLVLWYGWLRPLDLTGGTDPDAVGTDESGETE
jgi:hypothetical protein